MVWKEKLSHLLLFDRTSQKQKPSFTFKEPLVSFKTFFFVLSLTCLTLATYRISSSFSLSSVSLSGSNPWSSLVQPSDIPPSCRSTSGKTFVADELGHVCPWEEVEKGCCPSNSEQTRFSCFECNSTSSCCMHYEHCVSCCLNPTNRETIVSTLANTHNPVLKTATNAFDFCTATCRTSSQSVIHHKTYRNDDQKYCFSSSSSLSGAPSIQESVFQSRRVSETSTSSPEEGVTSSPLRKKEADIASDRLKQREPRKLFNDHTNSLYNRVYGSSGHHLHSGCLLLPLLVSAMFIFFVASFCSLKDEERKEKSL